MKLKDTVITAAGVLRCCVALIGQEYEPEKREIEVGSRSKCCVCQEPFTLVSGEPAGRPDFFIWLPDWQIAQDGDPQGVLTHR